MGCPSIRMTGTNLTIMTQIGVTLLKWSLDARYYQVCSVSRMNLKSIKLLHVREIRALPTLEKN
jgi:hypothetical protein